MSSVSPTELQSLASSGFDLVDVRDPHEWRSGHVPGARLVPLAQLQADPQGSLPRDDILFICAKGGRSAVAAEIAGLIGRTSVHSLSGGTDGWREAGLPIVVPETPRPLPTAGRQADEMPLEVIVGANLKRERLMRGWSLDDLAREAGIGRSELAQIEIGQAEPSIGSVWKIAHAMNVPFSTLLAHPDARSGTITSTRLRAKKLTSSDGSLVSRALHSAGDPEAAEFYEICLGSKSRHDSDPHRFGTRENIVVAFGELELVVGGDSFILRTGDSANFAGDQLHSYVNNSGSDCWFYLVMNYSKGQR